MSLFALRPNASFLELELFLQRQELLPRGERWPDDLSGSCERSGKLSGWQASGDQVGQGGDDATDSRDLCQTVKDSVFICSIL